MIAANRPVWYTCTNRLEQMSVPNNYVSLTHEDIKPHIIEEIVFLVTELIHWTCTMISDYLSVSGFRAACSLRKSTRLMMICNILHRQREVCLLLLVAGAVLAIMMKMWGFMSSDVGLTY